MMMMLAVSCGGGGSAGDRSGALFRLGSGLGCLTPTPVRVSGSPGQTQILGSKFRSGQASQKLVNSLGQRSYLFGYNLMFSKILNVSKFILLFMLF
ncbi:hypothetical protein HanRHA438_Chr06g0281481 [Helianthus annuus]|uniref:Uncharacterized protein n=1 Tax=Helianthus annuus TaxID=4232 RepID=A0A9K3IVA3_HELAN|nr:hypothetical protein HanXRQr2_Chr06g0272481 [Helianthus annuus]KAJ0568125.1 hypothetical protein HanIR_Chr06g0292601 [Helianthus annuus]KAJ0913078.1 hypothetical protein HanRHA438_Chr06g0281481 [Helianthus annuus]KAJ0916551.1 hypothetical protein HanPSC8_Chr06g0263021 [Helianthus annuus]